MRLKLDKARKIFIKIEVLFAFIVNCIKCKIRRKNKNFSNDVLIFSLGSLGDTVYIIDLLAAINETYKKSEKHVYFMGLSGTIDFLKKYSSIDLDYISMEFTTTSVSFTSYVNAYKDISKKKFDKIICLQRDIYIQSILLATSFDELLVFDNNTSRKKGILFKIFMKFSKAESYEYPYNTTWKERKKFIAEKLYIKEYLPEYPQIRTIENTCSYKSYLVFCPTAQYCDRSIPQELSAGIINYILDKTNMQIILSGNKKDIKYCNDILDKIDEKKNGRILNMVGRTSFDEFIDILSKSVFIISCDSGPAHLGPALGKRTLVVSGYWDSNIVFPYENEEMKDCLSLCIKSNKKYGCEGCSIFKHRGYNNVLCSRNIKDGKPVICLYDIEFSDIKTVLDRML